MENQPTEFYCAECDSVIDEGQESNTCPSCGAVGDALVQEKSDTASVDETCGEREEVEPTAPVPTKKRRWKIKLKLKMPKLKRQKQTREKQAEQEKPPRELVLCIKCGAPVRQGAMLCFNCLRTRPSHRFDNCLGPSIIMLGGVVWMVTLFVRALT